jgi:hypothetical protein
MSSASTIVSRQLEIYQAAILTTDEIGKCPPICLHKKMQESPLKSESSLCCDVTRRKKTAALSAREQIATAPIFDLTMDLGSALAIVQQAEETAANSLVQIENVPLICPRQHKNTEQP